jgi:putative phage-type endonuclease
MVGIHICGSGTDDWLAERQNGIGASEAAAACGMSPWQTPLELYLRKRGEMPPIDDNTAMRMGRKLEPVIVSEFEEATGLTVTDTPGDLYQHADLEWQRATPDGLIGDTELLECKSSSVLAIGSELGDDGTDDVPTAWLLQCQHQMAVLGEHISAVQIACLLDGRQLRLFRVERHDGLIAKLTATEQELWERIQNGDPPEADYAHATTLALLRVIHPVTHDETDVIDLDDRIHAAWSQYEDIGREIKALEKTRKAAKASVVDAIGSHYAGMLDDGRMVRRKLSQRSGYSVEASEVLDIRAVKIPSSLRVHA